MECISITITHIVWLVWSVNGNGSPTTANINAAVSTALDVIDRCRKVGVNIILVGAFPTGTAALSSAQQALYAQLYAFCNAMALNTGVFHLDVSGLSAAGSLGQWQPQYNYNADGLHPSVLAMNNVLVPGLAGFL